MGGALLPSDLLALVHTHVTPPALENASRAALPALSSGRWFRWNSTTAVDGGQTVRETLGLAEMSLYVRAGAILTLQANASRVQHTAQAGGGDDLPQFWPGMGRRVNCWHIPAKERAPYLNTRP